MFNVHEGIEIKKKKYICKGREFLKNNNKKKNLKKTWFEKLIQILV